MVTEKQKNFLNKLISYYGSDALPSYEIICRDLGLKSKNSVWQYLQKLIESNLILEKNNRYFISNELLGVDYYYQGVRAGFPSPAEDYPVQKISFDKMLIKSPSSTFTVRVIGDSMIDAGIHEDDIAVIQRGINPRDGNIVLAAVDGDFTLKYFRKKGKEIFLEAANERYPNIKYREELEIFGVMVGLVRQIRP